jgi:hypothetical protein
MIETLSIGKRREGGRRQTAAAPATISANSLVMLAWRVLL